MTELRTVTETVLRDIGLSPLEAKDLEIGIYNATIDYAQANKIAPSWQSELFQEAYLGKARSIYVNLKQDSHVMNPRLIERFKNREFIPHDLPFITRESIHPELWNPIIEKERLRCKEAYEVHHTAMTDQIYCGKCHKNKVTYYEMQTRSSDEPMSAFFTCLLCGHKWKH